MLRQFQDLHEYSMKATSRDSVDPGVCHCQAWNPISLDLTKNLTAIRCFTRLTDKKTEWSFEKWHTVPPPEEIPSSTGVIRQFLASFLEANPAW